MRTLLGLVFLPCLLGGCSLAPGNPSASGRLGAGEVAGLGAATAAGAILGDKLGGTPGAFIGGGAGLVAAAAIGNALAQAPADPPAEAARREERLKIMQRYWYEHTVAGPAGPGGEEPLFPAPPDDAPLTYPAGLYDGIRFAPRTATEPGIIEPFR